jgi:hypothetical protein
VKTTLEKKLAMAVATGFVMDTVGEIVGIGPASSPTGWGLLAAGEAANTPVAVRRSVAPTKIARVKIFFLIIFLSCL